MSSPNQSGKGAAVALSMSPKSSDVVIYVSDYYLLKGLFR